MTLTIVALAALVAQAPAPRPSPEEAVRILTHSVPPFNPSAVPPSTPHRVISEVRSKGPTTGPWDWPEPRPARRLDGTLLTDPPAFYMESAPIYTYDPYYNRPYVRRPLPPRPKR